MRKILFSFFSLLLFFTGLGSYFETYAAEADTCKITRRDDGSISQVKGRCTVCAWNLADQKCEATDAGFDPWREITACAAGSQLYLNNPAVCSGINDKDDCEFTAVGQCLLNEDADPNIKYKWVGYTIEPEFGCAECTLEPPGQPDVAGDNDVCKWDTPKICEEESGPGLKYKCVDNECTECPEGESGCKILSACREECEEEVRPTPNTPLSQPCTDTDEKWGCLKINTALGNVDTQAPEFVRWVLSFVLGVSGAVVLIIIIITGYRLMTSQGDPEKVKNAREALTAAIVGLLFIIFSLVILQFITVNVLQLPGFGN